MEFTYELVVDDEVRGIMKIVVNPIGAGITIDGDVQARLVENQPPQQMEMPPVLQQRMRPPRLR
jgi:hypothetical protein